VFLILLRYKTSLDEVNEVRPKHLEFLTEGFAEGKYVLAGRGVPPEFGVLIARGTDREEARKLAEADPYVQSGVAEYELLQFEARRTELGLEGDPEG
jgi:uncharacterized protein YciI